MKIGIIGTGYVGLPTGAGLAELGNEVICIDKDEAKIATLRQGKSPIYEEGLDELLARNTKAGRLKFTTSMKEGVEEAQVVILAVGTPQDPTTGEADLSYIYAAAQEAAVYLSDYTLIATKSTVMVGTGDKIEQIIKQVNPKADVDVVSLPEFLREGFAINDFFNPDRIVVGTESERAEKLLRELYRSFADKTSMLFVKRRSAEVIKYASNAFLAMKIHYINEMADFCEAVGADIAQVAKGMGLDSRIGAKFLNAGPGYGGSCFPKDTNAMAYMGRQAKVNLSLVEAAIRGNDLRQANMAERILRATSGKKDSLIAVWGLAFKSGTDDTRVSPAMTIVEQLLRNGARLRVYDPKAMTNAAKKLGNRVEYADTPESAIKGADVLAILTEWPEFAKFSPQMIKNAMRGNRIVDLRNMLSKEECRAKGLAYECIGEIAGG
ncbi:MAG: UDP-glucose/GDP-mannose dehydrogenase family protein [Alphaproteobacteria bacterium]|nr:UDP-glucose/GDP-mannose dehydrogenase family protein [Alphaproteobacteria bacterium]